MTSSFLLRAALAGAVLALAATAFADGVPVMPWYAGNQTRPGLSADGSGGAWLAFKSDSGRTGIVHLKGNGLADPSWPNGIYYTGLTTQTNSPARVLASAPDRVFLVTDYCAYDRLVTGYDSSGDTVVGFPTSATMFYPGPTSVFGADGRILSAVGGSLMYGGWGARVAIVSAVGELLTELEYDVGFQVPALEPYTAISDGAGGMLLALPVNNLGFTTGYDVGLTRIGPNGSRPWGNTAKLVSGVNADQRLIRIWPDGAGGALLTWNDSRTSGGATPLDIFASRYTSAGLLATGWTAGGKRITTAAGSQFESRVVVDTLGGAWIMWRDQRVTDIDLYFTHVLGNAAFAPGFSGLGTLLCGATGDASDPQMVPDGLGGFFAVWVDPRNGNSDLYGTHILLSGAVAPGWPADGLALCDDPASFQTSPVLVSTGPGTAMVAWRDSRGVDGNVYALALGPDGPSTTGVTPVGATALRLRAAANPAFGLPELRIAAPAGGLVEVELVDVAGRIVRRTSVRASGAETTARFDGGPLAAGIYFATARLGPERATLRLSVLR